MSTITVPLPDEDLAFLRAWSEKQGTSAEEYLARQARNLREHLQRPLHPGAVYYLVRKLSAAAKDKSGKPA